MKAQIQDTIDSLVDKSGGLERKGDVLKVLRLFNTVFSNQYNKSDIYSDATQGYSKNLENNPRELSLLLECFTHTINKAVLRIIAEVMTAQSWLMELVRQNQMDAYKWSGLLLFGE